MARVMTSGSLSKAGRPVFDGCSEAWSSFHQSSTSAYNETKKESRSIATPSFGESLVKHTVWAPSPLVRVTHQSSQVCGGRQREQPASLRAQGEPHAGAAECQRLDDRGHGVILGRRRLRQQKCCPSASAEAQRVWRRCDSSR